MITPSSAFNTANAALAKQPVYIIEVEGYSRAFGMKTGLGSIPGLSTSAVVQKSQTIWDVGGLELFSTAVNLAQPINAGDVLFYFMYYSHFETVTGIQDTGGNTWTALYNDGLIYAWSAIAAANLPGGTTISVNGGHTGALGGGNLECYAMQVSSAYSGFLSAGGTGSSPLSLTAGSTTVSFSTGTNTWNAVLVQLAPASGPTLPITLLFLHLSGWSGITIPGTLIQGAAAAAIYSAGGVSTVNDWLTSIEDLKITVSDLDGGADLSDLTFTVQDFGRQLTTDLASFTFEGKACVLLAGFVGMAIANYLTMFSGQIDTVESANGNTEYTFTASDVNIKRLTQKIYTLGDDGFATSSKHPHTIAAHPLDILIDALEQAGVPAAKIDGGKIAFYRDTIFNGYKFTFNLTSAPTAKNFIEDELMKPLGMYIRTDNLGMVTIVSFYPAISGNGSYTPPTPPVMTFTTDSIVGMVLETQADLINQVIFDFDDDGTGGSKFLAEEIVDYDVSIGKYGLVGGQTIQSQGMRSSFQGYFMAALIGRLICLRYGLKTMVLDPLTLFWNACVLEPGDIIAVTHPFLPDRVAGVVGVTTKAFEVMDRNWKFMAGRVEVKLLAIDLSKFKQYQITPNAETTYALATSVDKAQYMFQCDATGHYSTAAVANTLG